MEDEQKVNTHRKVDLNYFGPSLAIIKAGQPNRKSEQLPRGHTPSRAQNPQAPTVATRLWYYDLL